MTLGLFQILFIVLVAFVLFGRGRISEVLGDVGRGVKNFRRGLDPEAPAALPTARADRVADGGVSPSTGGSAKSG